MQLSNWEITYTILIFLAFIIVTSLNIFLLTNIIKNKPISKKIFWTLIILITLSEILILPAVILKIISFLIFHGSYQFEVMFAIWITFSALFLSMLALLLLPKANKKD